MDVCAETESVSLQSHIPTQLCANEKSKCEKITMGDGKKGRGKKDKVTRVLREKKEQAIKMSKRSGNDMS